ncbi:MAG: hypothetical protein OSJ74_10150, partial [Clostridia bacterium]|nr:hypothetical protein [Clostridia bacterium]
LQANRVVMDNMVKVLFEKETIYTEEVNMLFDGKTADEVIAYIDERQAKKDSYKRTSEPKINIVPEPSAGQTEEAANPLQTTESEEQEQVKTVDPTEVDGDKKE